MKYLLGIVLMYRFSPILRKLVKQLSLRAGCYISFLFVDRSFFFLMIPAGFSHFLSSVLLYPDSLERLGSKTFKNILSLYVFILERCLIRDQSVEQQLLRHFCRTIKHPNIVPVVELARRSLSPSSNRSSEFRTFGF